MPVAGGLALVPAARSIPDAGCLSSKMENAAVHHESRNGRGHGRAVTEAAGRFACLYPSSRAEWSPAAHLEIRQRFQSRANSPS